jgi:hypothetical protein
VAPSWLVDAAIYSEMKGGLHPWFTGLAVVGGVYVFGAVGAVYGPLALCVVYVLVNMYSTFMQEGVQLLPFHLKFYHVYDGFIQGCGSASRWCESGSLLFHFYADLDPTLMRIPILIII